MYFLHVSTELIENPSSIMVNFRKMPVLVSGIEISKYAPLSSTSLIFKFVCSQHQTPPLLVQPKIFQGLLCTMSKRLRDIILIIKYFSSQALVKNSSTCALSNTAAFFVCNLRSIYDDCFHYLAVYLFNTLLLVSKFPAVDNKQFGFDSDATAQMCNDVSSFHEISDEKRSPLNLANNSTTEIKGIGPGKYPKVRRKQFRSQTRHLS